MAPSSPSNAASLVLLRLRSPLLSLPPFSWCRCELSARAGWFGRMRTTSLFGLCVPATERYLHSTEPRGSVILKCIFFRLLFFASTYPVGAAVCVQISGGDVRLGRRITAGGYVAHGGVAQNFTLQPIDFPHFFRCPRRSDSKKTRPRHLLSRMARERERDAAAGKRISRLRHPRPFHHFSARGSCCEHRNK